jgi:hypothetical protein
MRIYLCGHGNHHMENGFFTLPEATTVTFYTLPFKLVNQNDTQAIVGGEVNLRAVRVIEGLQSCPNLTLTCDSDKDAILTRMAFKENPNRATSKLFFINNFITGPGEDSDASMTLKEIVASAPGNDFVWSCCYHVPLKKTLLGAKHGMNSTQYIAGGEMHGKKARQGVVDFDINKGDLANEVRRMLGKTIKELPTKAALKELERIDSPFGLPSRF